ncbi:MAG: TadE/TadG family type IV pilus assembly protein, partial [Actinomycetota bacterium]
MVGSRASRQGQAAVELVAALPLLALAALAVWQLVTVAHGALLAGSAARAAAR